MLKGTRELSGEQNCMLGCEGTPSLSVGTHGTDGPAGALENGRAV